MAFQFVIRSPGCSSNVPGAPEALRTGYRNESEVLQAAERSAASSVTANYAPSPALGLEHTLVSNSQELRFPPSNPHGARLT